ncbi:MAG: T9SS type A sorting domain-containing protein [Prevotella sp.]|nr:T9SS type A sorting domain-containing protein [Prevotella sp.]
MLEVYHSASTKPLISKVVRGNSTSVNTTGWQKGLYVIKANLKGNTLTEKIIIDNK